MMESGKTDGGSPRFIDDPNRNKRSKEASQAEVMFRRRLKIIQYLQAGHPNLESLANHCGCHIRTIQRDIDELRGCGYVINLDPEEKRFKISSDFLLPMNHFTQDEALALVTLCLEFGDQEQIPFLESVESAAFKLVGILPPPLKEFLQEIGGVLRIRREPVNPLTESRRIFLQILDEYRKRRSVRITYKSPLDPEPLRTLLSPYFVLFSRRSWYVIGRSSIHLQTRTFHLGRIVSLEETENTFEVPRGFSLKQYLRNAWHLIPEPGPDSKVIVRFSKLVAQNVAEVRWHATQHTIPLNDGGIEFHATVSGLHEIAWWILGYGKEAEVIAPEGLRAIIRRHVEALASRYLSSNPAEPPRPSHEASKRPHVDLPGWSAE